MIIFLYPTTSPSRNGFGLIEVVIVTAIISIVLGAFLQTGVLAIRLLRAEKENLEATMLAQEGMEAVRSLRDNSWTNNIVPLTNDTIYYPVVINGKWTLTLDNPGYINNKYSRQITFGQVLRDGSDRIAISGSIDEGTRKVSVAVLWGGKQTQLTAYLTDFPERMNPPGESNVISFEGALTDTDIISFPSDDIGDGDPAQSFTTSVDVLKITRVDLLLRRTTPSPSDIYVEIRVSPIGAIVGTSHLINASTILTSSAAWVEFRFAPEITLAPSTNYYIRLRSNPLSSIAGSGSKGSLNWIYLQTPSSPYDGGVARRYIERLNNPADIGEQLDQYDFGFKIYAL